MEEKIKEIFFNISKSKVYELANRSSKLDLDKCLNFSKFLSVCFSFMLNGPVGLSHTVTFVNIFDGGSKFDTNVRDLFKDDAGFTSRAFKGFLKSLKDIIPKVDTSYMIVTYGEYYPCSAFDIFVNLFWF